MQNLQILADLLLGYFWLVKKGRKKERKKERKKKKKEDQGEIDGIPQPSWIGLSWNWVRVRVKAKAEYYYDSVQTSQIPSRQNTHVRTERTLTPCPF